MIKCLKQLLSKYVLEMVMAKNYVFAITAANFVFLTSLGQCF